MLLPVILLEIVVPVILLVVELQVILIQVIWLLIEQRQIGSILLSIGSMATGNIAYYRQDSYQFQNGYQLQGQEEIPGANTIKFSINGTTKDYITT